ncbi:MAG: hypothetical protein CR997_09595 [Acidobacteria bacterium]|nr:MAG: hypothetical protein CR997_09595 [Acidobacteriota bacterium]
MEKFPEIGETIDSRWEPNQVIQLFPEMSELIPAYSVKYDGIRLVLQVSEKNTIFSIQTYDQKFVTPEGIRVGSTIKQIFDRCPETCLQPRKVYFWVNGEKRFQLVKNEYEILLPSGWKYLISCHDGFPLNKCCTYELMR